MKRYVTLILFIALVLGGGTLIGVGFQPGDWYAALRKPPFNPPNWIFAPVWSTLYVLIAIAGWRTWMRQGWQHHTRQRTGWSAAMAAWVAQLVLNFLWSPVFFGLHQPGIALIVMLALLAAIVVFIQQSWTRDRPAAALFVPYAGWVAFAMLLNASIWVLN